MAEQINGEIFQSPSTGKRYLRRPDGSMVEGELMTSQSTGSTYWSVEGELTPVQLSGNKVVPQPPGAPDTQLTGTPVDPHASYKQYEALPDLTKGIRAAGKFGRGVAEQAGAYAGGLMDLSAAGTEAMGLTGPGQFRENISAGIDKAADVSAGAASSVLGDMGPADYSSNLDKIARGSGKSLVDTATFLGGGRLLRSLPQKYMASRGVGGELTKQPGMQFIAGGTGGAAQELGNDPYTSMAVSAATPGLIGATKTTLQRGISPLARSTTHKLSKQRKDMIKVAEDNNIPLTTGQVTNSRFLQVLESTFAQLPITTRHQMALFHEQRSAFNRAVLARAGMSGDDASPQAINDAFENLGSRYASLAERTSVTMDDEAFKELDSIIRDYAGKRLPKDVADQFKQAVDDINQMRAAAGMGRTGPDGTKLPTGTEVGAYTPENAVKVELDGETYQNIVSNLKRTARDTPAPELARAFNRLASMMDGAMERTAEYVHQAAKPAPSQGKAMVPYDPSAVSHLSPPPTGKELRAEYLALNKQYRNLLTIARAMGKGTQAERTDAMVPLSGLKQAVQGMDGVIGYSRGKGDLNDLARVGDLLGSTNVPDSHTAIRQAVMRILGGGIPTVAGGSAALSGADPATIAAAAAGGVALPRGVQKTYQSPMIQAYLRNQKVRPGPTQQTNNLLLKVLAAQQQGQTIDDLQELPR